MDLVTEFVAVCSKLLDIGLPVGCIIASERLWPSSLTTFCRVPRLPASSEFVWSGLLCTTVSVHSMAKKVVRIMQKNL